MTLIEFLNHRNFLIEKYSKIPKYIIPKQIHLIFHPRFDEDTSITTVDLEKFSYSGYIFVTVVSKKSNNKRIEMNLKNLKISFQDVKVFRSISWTSIDFDDDPDINSKEIKYIVVQRNKREIPDDKVLMNETITVEAENTNDLNVGAEEMDESANEDARRNKTYFYPKFVSIN